MSNHPLIQFATQPQLKTARGDMNSRSATA